MTAGPPGSGGGRRGRLVAFEGGEASGKSTHATALAERVGALLTREPGGTAIGGRIREIVLDPATVELDLRAEALLLAADRAQHVREVLLPALEAGHDVVTDRFSGSTLAYQGWGQGLDVEELAWLSGWASSGLEPDLVLLLDAPVAVTSARLRSRGLDRMEASGGPFHDRVREGYRSLAAADPGRWAVIDGSGTLEEVADRVWRAYSAWTEARGRGGG